MQNIQKPISYVKGIPTDHPTMASFNASRQQSREFLLDNGFPTNKDEGWRFTNIQPIVNQEYDYGFHPPSNPFKKNLLLSDAYQININSGGYNNLDQFSEFTLTSGCTIERLVSSENNSTVKALFSTIVPAHQNAFTALNTALFQDGLIFIVPDNIRLDKPVHFHLENEIANHPTNINFRFLIILGKNSKCTIVLSNEGVGESSFSNFVTEIMLSDNSQLDYHVIQFGGENDHQITNTGISLEDNARVHAQYFSTGGKTIRNDLTVNLSGQGAECDIRGLILGKNNGLIDNHSLINHIAPNCTSNEIFKGVLTDTSHGVFDGLVTVFPNAQLTSANQKNQTLLLSKDATTNSNPRLQINADNVKCSHGSTTGELDMDAVFYLQSRGISEEMAKFMLIQGFALEILDSISNESVKKILQQAIEKYLIDIKRTGS